jgi:hypothetical protein
VWWERILTQLEGTGIDPGFPRKAWVDSVELACQEFHWVNVLSNMSIRLMTLCLNIPRQNETIFKRRNGSRNYLGALWTTLKKFKLNKTPNIHLDQRNV